MAAKVRLERENVVAGKQYNLSITMLLDESKQRPCILNEGQNSDNLPSFEKQGQMLPSYKITIERAIRYKHKTYLCRL